MPSLLPETAAHIGAVLARLAALTTAGAGAGALVCLPDGVPCCLMVLPPGRAEDLDGGTLSLAVCSGVGCTHDPHPARLSIAFSASDGHGVAFEADPLDPQARRVLRRFLFDGALRLVLAGAGERHTSVVELPLGAADSRALRAITGDARGETGEPPLRPLG